MRKEKKITISIEICDICGISYEEHRKKYPKEWKGTNTCGFGSIYIKTLKYISVCPTCLKRKEKDWKWFEEIIKKKIEIRRLTKRV